MSTGMFAPPAGASVYSFLSATSNTKTPSGSGQFHQLTNNSLTLTAGTWMLFGSGDINNSGVSPTYTEAATHWKGANGADSASTPAALSTVCTVISVFPSVGSYLNPAVANVNTIPAQTTIVQVASTATVYLVTYSSQSTSANARVVAYANALRIA